VICFKSPVSKNPELPGGDPGGIVEEEAEEEEEEEEEEVEEEKEEGGGEAKAASRKVRWSNLYSSLGRIILAWCESEAAKSLEGSCRDEASDIPSGEEGTVVVAEVLALTAAVKEEVGVEEKVVSRISCAKRFIALVRASLMCLTLVSMAARLAHLSVCF
jgi:hypothetical protein